MQEPTPMVPVLPLQAASPAHDSAPTSPLLSRQARKPVQARSAIVSGIVVAGRVAVARQRPNLHQIVGTGRASHCRTPRRWRRHSCRTPARRCRHSARDHADVVPARADRVARSGPDRSGIALTGELAAAGYRRDVTGIAGAGPAHRCRTCRRSHRDFLHRRSPRCRNGPRCCRCCCGKSRVAGARKGSHVAGIAVAGVPSGATSGTQLLLGERGPRHDDRRRHDQGSARPDQQ